MSNPNTYSEKDPVKNDRIDEIESTKIIVIILIPFLIIFIGVLIYYLSTKPPVVIHHVTEVPAPVVQPYHYQKDENESKPYDINKPPYAQ